jgi:hypothetical protein
MSEVGVTADQARLRHTLDGLDIHDHACLVFRDRREELAAAVPYIKTGLRLNDRCVYVADEHSVDEVLLVLRQGGVDVEAVVASGQLEVVTKNDSYVKDQNFEPKKAQDFFTKTATEAWADGYRALRAGGEMTWQLANHPGSERLMEYESAMNEFFREYSVIGMCQYNLERFSAEVILDALRTHPKVIIGGLVCRNIYFVPPEEFRSEDQEVELERMLMNIYEYQRSEIALEESHRLLEKTNFELEQRVKALEQEVAQLQSDSYKVVVSKSSQV